MPACKGCGENKPLTAFPHARDRGKLRPYSYCKPCTSTRSTEQRARRRRVARQRVLQYLRANPCVDCGECDVLVLEFDHRHQHQKKAKVTELVTQARTWQRIEDEIAKCDVRCANCHRRRTHKQLGWHARSR